MDGTNTTTHASRSHSTTEEFLLQEGAHKNLGYAVRDSLTHLQPRAGEFRVPYGMFASASQGIIEEDDTPSPSALPGNNPAESAMIPLSYGFSDDEEELLTCRCSHSADHGGKDRPMYWSVSVTKPLLLTRALLYPSTTDLRRFNSVEVRMGDEKESLSGDYVEMREYHHRDEQLRRPYLWQSSLNFVRGLLCCIVTDMGVPLPRLFHFRYNPNDPHLSLAPSRLTRYFF
ncbi:unnamed protein product [Amoebophrya sp. A25]|nr:unnamed protein product [Amoebophrya sp. A25]|eukprot:GSA25T00007384001.1